MGRLHSAQNKNSRASQFEVTVDGQTLTTTQYVTLLLNIQINHYTVSFEHHNMYTMLFIHPVSPG